MNRKILKEIEEDFSIPAREIRRFIKNFHSEMKRGLSGRGSSLKMIPTHVKTPTGNECGQFLALDLGGTNFRVAAVKLKGNRKDRILLTEKFILKKELMKGDGKKLFSFLAQCVKKSARKLEKKFGEQYDIGFTFSFPVLQKSISSGVLIRWTKGFSARGVEGKDVVGLLNKALQDEGLQCAKVVALANDTVSTLVAKSYEDPNCDIGVILGTGTNACYSKKDGVIINIEWGNFNKIKRTKYDTALDRLSENPGEQILEKMVSGMYLGEIARLIARDVMKKKAAIFNKPFGFKTERMSAIEKNKSEMTMGRICAAVSGRAARISAAAIVSVLTWEDPHLGNKHTVAIDGSVYEKYHGFSEKINQALKEILGKNARKVRLVLTKDASAKGAAIIAASR